MAILKQLSIKDGQQLGLPVGTTAQRPTPAAMGMMRVNTSIGWVEYYDGSDWKPVINAPGDGLTAATAGRSARAIKALTGTSTTGFYWIKAPGMALPIRVYCDMSYDGGGYMLITYGYVGSTGDSSVNRNLPPLNHDGDQFAYHPTSRASQNGLVTTGGAQQTAVKLGRESTQMIFAAGSNPSTGGINSYDYVYRIDIPNPKELDFRNHSTYYLSGTDVTAQRGAAVNVVGLKGDTSTVTKYCQLTTIAISWGDSYPSGYGLGTNSNPAGGGISFDGGPFFPSMHSSSGYTGGYAGGGSTRVTPDLGTTGYTHSGGNGGNGSLYYTYRGWYRGDSAGTTNNTGQTSIWFK